MILDTSVVAGCRSDILFDVIRIVNAMAFRSLFFCSCVVGIQSIVCDGGVDSTAFCSSSILFLHCITLVLSRTLFLLF